MINVPEPRYILLSAITTSKHRKDSIWQTTDIIGRIISDKDLHLKLQQQSDGLGEQVHAWRERGKNTIILGRDKIEVKKWNWQHFEVHENELNPRSLRAISVSNDFFFLHLRIPEAFYTHHKGLVFFRHNTPLLRRSCMTYMRPWPLTYLHYFD